MKPEPQRPWGAQSGKPRQRRPSRLCKILKKAIDFVEDHWYDHEQWRRWR